eukprot:g4996.t1
MDCLEEEGLTIAKIPIKKGFWRSHDGTNDIKPCPVQDACVNSSCATGHQGPYCMVCSTGYSRWQRTQLCEPCPESMAWGIIRSIFALVLCIALLVIFLRLNRRAPNGVIKPFINASQMIQVLLMFEIDWPSSFSTVASVFSGINLDAVSLVSPSCMGIAFDYHRRLGTMVGLTVAILAFPWIRDFVLRQIRKRRRGQNYDAAEAWKTSLGYRLRDTSLIILLIHPTLSGYAFSFFNCKFVEEVGGAHVLNNRTGSYYMAADYGLQCYDKTYNGMLVLAISIVALFSIGIPLFFAAVLWKKREQLQEPETKHLLGMLYMSYKPEYYWYESVQMLFKLGLWAALTFFKDDPQIKIAVAQLICIVQVALHTRLRPFNSEFKNLMQALGIFLALAVAFGGLVISYLKVSAREAHLMRRKELAEALDGKLAGFQLLLEILFYLTLTVSAAKAVFEASFALRKHKDRIRRKCRKYCPCLKIPKVEDKHEQQDEQNRDVELRAVSGHVGESKTMDLSNSNARRAADDGSLAVTNPYFRSSRLSSAKLSAISLKDEEQKEKDAI